MGGYPDGKYGNSVNNTVSEAISERNICEGVFLSQGKINPERTEYRKTLSKNHPHYLDEEGIKRHMESRKHLNQDHIDRAWEFLNNKLGKIKVTQNEEYTSVCEDGEPCIQCGMCSL